MTVWLETDRWTYRYLEPDVDPASIPEFEGLIRIWQGKRGDRRAPAWSDFDFYDFVGWHGQFSVYDVRYDPFDYTTRLSGTQQDALLGRTMTGLTRADFNEYYLRDSEIDAFSEFICRNLYISYLDGPLNVKGREFKRVRYLELPLSDDGVRAQNTIESILPVDDV
eukprot:g442.t1